MKDIGEKLDKKLPPEVEQFCSILASVAMRVARRCQDEEFKNAPTPNPPRDNSILNEHTIRRGKRSLSAQKLILKNLKRWRALGVRFLDS